MVERRRLQAAPHPAEPRRSEAASQRAETEPAVEPPLLEVPLRQVAQRVSVARWRVGALRQLVAQRSQGATLQLAVKAVLAGTPGRVASRLRVVAPQRVPPRQQSLAQAPAVALLPPAPLRCQYLHKWRRARRHAPVAQTESATSTVLRLAVQAAQSSAPRDCLVASIAEATRRVRTPH